MKAAPNAIPEEPMLIIRGAILLLLLATTTFVASFMFAFVLLYAALRLT